MQSPEGEKFHVYAGNQFWSYQRSDMRVRERKPRREVEVVRAPADEIALLKELLGEQRESAVERARSDPKRKSATWIATGDHLVLLVVDAVSVLHPKVKTYVCQVLDVTDE